MAQPACSIRCSRPSAGSICRHSSGPTDDGGRDREARMCGQRVHLIQHQQTWSLRVTRSGSFRRRSRMMVEASEVTMGAYGTRNRWPAFGTGTGARAGPPLTTRASPLSQKRGAPKAALEAEVGTPSGTPPKWNYLCPRRGSLWKRAMSINPTFCSCWRCPSGKSVRIRSGCVLSAPAFRGRRTSLSAGPLPLPSLVRCLFRIDLTRQSQKVLHRVRS
jgi:hypothetical protein